MSGRTGTILGPRASPLARRIARQAGVELPDVGASALGGRVVAEDVRREALAKALGDSASYLVTAHVDPQRATEVVASHPGSHPAVTLCDLVVRVCASALRLHLPDLEVAVVDSHETPRLPRPVCDAAQLRLPEIARARRLLEVPSIEMGRGLCAITDLGDSGVASGVAPPIAAQSISLTFARTSKLTLTIAADDRVVPLSKGLSFLETVRLFLSEPALAL